MKKTWLVTVPQPKNLRYKKSVTRIPGCTDVRQVGVDEGSAPAKQSPIAAPMLQPESDALQPYKSFISIK